MSLSTPKGTKEEVTRSQTYQQFMRNMEQIIEMLDDTESPNFDSGKATFINLVLCQIKSGNEIMLKM